MFKHILSMLDVQSDKNSKSVVNMAGALDSPSPELDQLPLGSDNQTWRNIVRNKRNMIFCDTQFQYVGNRIRCTRDFTHGPLLD